MTKPVTGQYECLHRSGVGLDYFTSRIDRLILQANGRFTLVTQDRSRIMNAAQSLLSGQQVRANTPETRREGTYTRQDKLITFFFEDGTQQQAQLSWNEEGIQLGTSFFQKVSDSTVLPPANRLKQNMEDISKGLKIAGAIGGIALKAAKSIHDTLQAAQSPQANQPGQGSAPPLPNNAGNPSSIQGQGPAMGAPTSSQTPTYPTPSQQTTQRPYTPPQPPQQNVETHYCDQCGAPVRPGKHFCNRCGAQLPL
jgi:hypothetical protein